MIPSCGRPHKTKGYCALHARRFRDYGDPLFEPPHWRKGKFSLRSYSSAEYRAKSLIPRTGCALADDVCRGELEMTFRYDAPARFVRTQDDGVYAGRLYYVGPNVEDGYRWLCRLHHSRTDPRKIAGLVVAASKGSALTSAAMQRTRPAFAEPGTWREYQLIHRTARNQNQGRACALLDGTCKGSTHQSLRLDTPTDRLRNVADRIDPDRAPGGRVYSISADDYDPLCRSHATRRDMGYAEAA